MVLFLKKWRQILFEKMKWEDAYRLWNDGRYDFPEILSSPATAEPIFVEYEEDGYFYGFDWLQNNMVQERKWLIQKKPLEFLYFTKPSNKGTIQTAAMLVEAQSDEERAAVWIAATAKELSECGGENNIRRYSNTLYMAACEFLKDYYYLCHHAMKKLVPEIMIPQSVLENIVCKDAEPIMGLIQMNTVLLKSTWSILRYSSLKDGELPESHYRVSN